MKEEIQTVIYWDASAILSALFQDSSSKKAIEWSRKPGVHLISTLSYAEVLAVIARLKKERLLANVLIQAALEALENGPWRHLNIYPEWEEIKILSQKRFLRGADLWHLAISKTLQKQLPELILLTFDKRLNKVASKEHLSP